MSNAALDPASIAVASDNQLSTTLSGEVVILGLQDTVYYGLQEVGARVWELLQTPRPIRQIVAQIVAEYEVSEAAAAPDIARLLGALNERGLITIESAHRVRR
jgi:hypothetical protein